MSDVLSVVDAWVYAELSGDSQLATLVSGRVYEAQAPKGAEYPMVLFHVQATAPDVIAVGTFRIFSEVVLTVRAISAGSGYGGCREIAKRVDEVLHGGRGSTEYGTVLSCYRERPIKLPPESVGDLQYWALGGVYRVIARGG